MSADTAHGTGAATVRTNAGWWYLDRHLEQDTADRLCLIDGEEELTYRQVHDRVCRTARVLAEGGIAPGDRVVTVLDDGTDAVAVVLAAIRLGAVPVPVSPMLTADEKLFVVADSGARGFVAEEVGAAQAADLADRFPGMAVWSRTPGAPGIRSLTEEVRAAAPRYEVAPRAAADPAVVQYTSGSTGRPKGVVHLHGGLLAFPQGLGGRLGLTREDRLLSTAKLSFGYGFGNSLLLPFSVGASVVLFGGRSEPFAVAGLLSRTRPTVLFAVPTLYAAMLALPNAPERLDFSSVRLAVSAGEHLGASLSRRLSGEFGLRMVNGLGATECLHIFMATEPGVSPPGTTGTPVPGFEAQLVDDEGRVLGVGDTGQLRVRGASTGDHYWGRPGLSGETFRDGWVYTGDTMTLDAERGWLYLGRNDAILNVAGMKIVPNEIEDAIHAVPGVELCTVIGVPDEDDVTRIVAHVVPAGGAGDELRGQVLASLRRTLPPYKQPRTVRLVDRIPTTSTGKTARFLSREREMESRR
ncbi:benzoate-CoA ligase family protein [Streptomyces sp. NPDC089919]|uniref:benzoate-CoA ligase family protein n=1 Tax=Streptomyces sp. NPDC089919 TaxID=3155188 RepID=UPI00342B9BBC